MRNLNKIITLKFKIYFIFNKIIAQISFHVIKLKVIKLSMNKNVATMCKKSEIVTTAFLFCKSRN